MRSTWSSPTTTSPCDKQKGCSDDRRTGASGSAHTGRRRTERVTSQSRSNHGDRAYATVAQAQLSVPPGTAKVEATPTGTLNTERGPIGTLQVVKFDNEIGLKKAGTNLFETDQAPQKADGFTLQQNVIETSNVKPVLELTKMISLQGVQAQMASTSTMFDAMFNNRNN